MVKKISLFCCCCLIWFALCSCSDNDCSCSDSCRECGESSADERVYKASAILYINDGKIDLSNSSSEISVDEELFSDLESLLDSDRVHKPVKQEYPNTEYRCYLENTSETEMIKIVVFAASKEDSVDICNAITKSFCEAVDYTFSDISVKIVDYASEESPEV